MQIVKFAIVALLVCIFVAAVFGQGRGGQDYETAAVTGTSQAAPTSAVKGGLHNNMFGCTSQKGADDINEYHYGEIRKAVADHYDQRRSGGKDIDVEIDIKKLEIEFEKNFYIAIKKVGIELKLLNLYFYISIFLYFYISIFLYFYISIFLYFYISIFLYFYISYNMYIYIFDLYMHIYVQSV
jgi:hypothetical protein